MMVVIDASVLVSDAVSTDINHVVSRNWLRSYINNGNEIVVPTLVLPELSGPVMRRTQSNAGLAGLAVTQFKSLPRLRLVEIDQTLAENAAQLAITLRLRGADAIYVALAQQLNIPLVTWDNEQLNRAAGIVQTFTPATAP